MAENELQNMTGRGGVMPDPNVAARRVIWGGAASLQGTRDVPRETPIALTYNRSTHAVML
ncbi:MAG: hypothetical protein QOG25_2670, partial [Acetobacteraceae bacterium]|nr:hypothetical protein [Acetobacteraceae bacterium]